MKLKVISGGQTGADRAGLDVARSLGLETGGTAPAEFWTTDGPAPELKEYGLTELSIGGADGYRKRTAQNVRDADLTIAIASNFNSPGEKLTRSTCAKYGKPIIAVHFSSGDDLHEWIKDPQVNQQLDLIVKRLKQLGLTQEVVTLNVAGNSAKTSPRCYVFAVTACDKIFKRVIEDEQTSSSI